MSNTTNTDNYDQMITRYGYDINDVEPDPCDGWGCVGCPYFCNECLE